MSGAERQTAWLGWAVMCCGLAISVLAGLQWVPAMRPVLQESAIPGLDERLTNVKPDEAAWLREEEGGRWGRYGWYLGPHAQGAIRIRLPFAGAGLLKLRVWAFNAGSLTGTVSDGAGMNVIPADQLDGRYLRVTIHGPAELILTASSDLPEEQLVLDRFSATWSQSDDRIPSLLPFLLGIGLSIGGVLVLASRSSIPRWHQWIGCAAIVTATIVGAGQRMEAFDMARGHAVDPDVSGYRGYAQGFEWFSGEHGFYSGSFKEREPLHIAGLNLWFRFWGDTFPAVRLYTVVQSILLVAACGAFVWCLSGKWFLGAPAAWVMAVNPVLVEESVRGLRTESLTLLLLAAISLWLYARGWWGAVGLAIAVGAMALVQAPAISIVLFVVGSGWIVNVWRERYGYGVLPPQQWRWPHVVLLSVLAALLYLPHVYGLYKVYGDPSTPSYGYARWNANFEFPERLGSPGFPSAEEFSRNTYAGPRISYGEYLFGLHSIPTLVKGQIKGWIESTVYMSASVTPHINDYIFLFHASGIQAVTRHLTVGMVGVFVLSIGFTVVGWLDLWRSSQYWWIPVLTLWGTWYVAYLYSVRLVEAFRHTGHVYPLLLFCLLWGGFRSLSWIGKSVWPKWRCCA